VTRPLPIRCADGHITIGAGTDRLFLDLADTLGHREWGAMPEFADTGSRVANRAALIERIEAVTQREPRASLLAKLTARGIPCGPINTYAEAFADPQVQAREMVVPIDHPTLGRTRALGSPVKFSETPARVGRYARAP